MLYLCGTPVYWKMTLTNWKDSKKKAIGLTLGTTYLDHKRYYKVNGKAVSYEIALNYLELPTLAERR